MPSGVRSMVVCDGRLSKLRVFKETINKYFINTKLYFIVGSVAERSKALV